MTCNGKMYPFKSDVNFEIVAYGTNQKGKIIVETQFDKALQQWKLNKMELKTLQQTVTII